jgi:hypothetical protein
MNYQRLLIRTALVVLWIALGIFIFVQYRGHTVLVDNKNVEEPALQAPNMITVSLNGGKALEFLRGDRDRFTVTGSKHLITIEFSDGTQAFEKAFRLDIKNDMYLLSIPKLIAGVEPFVEVFHQNQEPRPPADDAFIIEEFL